MWALAISLGACGSARRLPGGDAGVSGVDGGPGASDADRDAGPRDGGTTPEGVCQAEADATGARWVTAFLARQLADGARVQQLVAYGPGGRRVLEVPVDEGLGVWRPPTYAWRRRGDAVVVQMRTPDTAIDRCPTDGCVTRVAVFGPEDVRTWSARWRPEDVPGDEVVWALRDGRFVIRSARGARLVSLGPDGVATERPLEGDVLWLSDHATPDGWHGAIVADGDADGPRGEARAAFARPGGATRTLGDPAAPRWSAVAGDFGGGSLRFTDDGRWLFTRFVSPARWELVAAGPDDVETVALPLELFDRSDDGVVHHGALAVLGQAEARRGGWAYGAPTAIVDRRSGDVTAVPWVRGADVRTRFRNGVALTSVGGVPRLRVDLDTTAIETLAVGWGLPPGGRALDPSRMPELTRDGRIGLTANGEPAGLYVELDAGDDPSLVGRPVWATAMSAHEVGGTWWLQQSEVEPRAGTPPPGTVRGDATQLVRGDRTWVFPFFHGPDRPQRTVYPTRAGRCAVLYDREADPPRFELVDLVTGQTADLAGALGAPFFLQGLDEPW